MCYLWVRIDITVLGYNIVLVSSETFSLVILNDLNISLSTSISVASCLVLSILFVQWPNHSAILIFLQ